MKAKILFINPIQFGYSAGHYHYCKYLENDYDITYITFDQGFDKVFLEKTKVIYCNRFNNNKVLNILNFVKFCLSQISTGGFNSYIVVNFLGCFFIPLLSKNKNSVIDIRSGAVGNDKNKVLISNAFFRFQSLFFKKIIVLSNGMINLLKLNKNKTTVVSLGAEKISTLEKDYTNLNLLYVGTLSLRNINDTVLGIKKFIDVNKGIKLTYDIIGFGSKDTELSLLKCIKENNLSDVVKFHGRKNYRELIPFFDKANIGVAYIPNTPIFHNQPSTKIFEYALSGLFTIATNTKENKKLINKNNGVIVEDSPIGIRNALNYYIIHRDSLDFNKIMKSLDNYYWPTVINNYLKGVIDTAAL